jgi:transglutaminase-like putative cysteine protease
MKYRISHVTTYTYTEPVALCHNLVRLAPRPLPGQHTEWSQVQISPPPAVSWTGNDFFGNPLTFFTVQQAHKQLMVSARHLTEVRREPPPTVDATPPWELARDQLRQDRSEAVLDARQYLFDSMYVQSAPEIKAYASISFPPGRSLLAGVLDLTNRIHSEFRYDPEATTVTTPLREVLTGRRGVCQDFAHLEIGCLRSLGLPARYVSGYLRTYPPPGKERLIGADASHAWLSVYCPDIGWIDTDPTNNVIPTNDHIVLAWGRDYDDVCPVKGVILGTGTHTVSVSVDVQPLP